MDYRLVKHPDYSAIDDYLANSEAQTIIGLNVRPAPIPTNSAKFAVEGTPSRIRFQVWLLLSGAIQVLIDNSTSIIVNPIVRSVPV